MLAIWRESRNFDFDGQAELFVCNTAKLPLEISYFAEDYWKISRETGTCSRTVDIIDELFL